LSQSADGRGQSGPEKQFPNEHLPSIKKQGLKQLPHAFGLMLVSVSQNPSESQSAKGGPQVKGVVQTPPEQEPEGQKFPQKPQLNGSLSVKVSQNPSKSQSAKGGLQVGLKVQKPSEQEPEGQKFPQKPQLN